jgi:hypothetical protein
MVKPYAMEFRLTQGWVTPAPPRRLGQGSDPEDGITLHRCRAGERGRADGLHMDIGTPGHQGDQTRDDAGLDVGCQHLVQGSPAFLREAVWRGRVGHGWYALRMLA